MLEETITEVSQRTPIWYPTMSNEEREELLANYKPEDHLTSWEKGGEALIYYPSAWRLYELRLRFPEAMLDTDIYHFNENTGLVILVTKLYVGASYEESRLRAKAFKQGSVGKLDALQTMCEARVARNFGISPTLALDVDDTDIAKIAIRSEAEHQAKRNAAAKKRIGQTRQEAQAQLEQKRASMKKIAETLQIDMPANITLEIADGFIKDHRAAYQEAKRAATASAQPAARQETTAPAVGLKKDPSSQSDNAEPGQANAPVQVEFQEKQAALSDTSGPITEAQIASLRRLYERLGKESAELPQTYQGAKDLIAQLSLEYKARSTSSSTPAQPATKSAPAPAPTASENGKTTTPATGGAPASKERAPLSLVIPSLQQLIALADKRYPGGWGALHTAVVKQGLPRDHLKWTEPQRKQAYEAIKASQSRAS